MTEPPVTHSNRLARVLANAGMMLGGRTVNAIVTMGAMALAGRALGLEVFGVLVLINAFAQFIGEVVKFQSWQTVLHFGAGPVSDGRREDFQRVVRFSLVLDIVSAIGGMALGVAGALLFGDWLGVPPDQKTACAIYALSIAVMAPATPTGVLRLFNRFAFLSGQSAIGGIVRLLGSIAAFALDASLDVFLLVWAAGSVATFVYLCVGAWKEMHGRDLVAGFGWSGPLTHNMPGAWRFAWATNAASSLDVAFTHLATLLVGGMIGAGDAALWRVGRQVADALAKPARLVILALYPELARLRGSEGEKAMRKLALQTGLVGGAVATVLLLVTTFFGGPLLGLIMGAEFAPAAAIMTWQVAAAVIGVWAMPLEPMLVSLGRPGEAVRVRLVVTIAFLAALFPLVHAFGLAGAGAGLVGAALAMALGMLGFLIVGRRGPKNRSAH